MRSKIEQLTQELAEALSEIEALKTENKLLSEKLGLKSRHKNHPPAPYTDLAVNEAHSQLSTQEKISLFRSLFKGREDVYPSRWDSKKTGKSGYSPACGNEWVPRICEKPRIKCSDCPNQYFLYSLMVQDSGRNDLIFEDLIRALEAKRSPLVLT